MGLSRQNDAVEPRHSPLSPSLIQINSTARPRGGAESGGSAAAAMPEARLVDRAIGEARREDNEGDEDEDEIKLAAGSHGRIPLTATAPRPIDIGLGRAVAEARLSAAGGAK